MNQALHDAMLETPAPIKEKDKTKDIATGKDKTFDIVSNRNTSMGAFFMPKGPLSCVSLPLYSTLAHLSLYYEIV